MENGILLCRVGFQSRYAYVVSSSVGSGKAPELDDASEHLTLLVDWWILLRVEGNSVELYVTAFHL